MRIYETPGVYYERTDASQREIQALRTDIAGFVGIAERGPFRTPIPIESWRQFEAYFGGFTGQGYLAYAVRAFFENGGRRCWVVRVASGATTTAAVGLQARVTHSMTTGPTWHRIEAISSGGWGNNLEVTIKESHRAQTKTIPLRSQTDGFVVEMTTGFVPRGMVRLTQPGVEEPAYRVIRAIDPDRSRIIFSKPITELNIHALIVIESVEYTLLVHDGGKFLRAYEGLSLAPGHPRYGPDVLPSLSEQIKRMNSDILPSAPEPIAIIESSDVELIDPIYPLDLPGANNGNGGQYVVSLQGGADGLAALRWNDFTGEEISPAESDSVREYKLRGITAINAIDEVAIVALPDIHIQPQPLHEHAPSSRCVPDPCLSCVSQNPTALLSRSGGDNPPILTNNEIFRVQAYLVNQCEKRRDRFAILDAPYSFAKEEKMGTASIRQWRSRFESTYSALYYPWVKVVDPLRNSRSLTRDIPPSGHVAGLIAKGDLAVGVHKAPANVELKWAADLTGNVNEVEHGLLNSLGINALRAYPGRGIRIVGARTMSSDPDWRFINVRRLLMMVEEAIQTALQWVVFEPNDHITRAKVTLSLQSFLFSLWQKGALLGAISDDAFFVKCDDVNNPPAERGNGRLLAEVGVAVSQPLEFVVLRVGRIDNALEITESGILDVNGRG